MPGLAEMLNVEPEAAEPDPDELPEGDMLEVQASAAEDMIEAMKSGDAMSLVEAYKRLKEACEAPGMLGDDEY